MKKLTISKAVYIFVWSILIMYLLFANTFASQFYSKGNGFQKAETPDQNAASDVSFFVDRFLLSKDFFETINFRGYFFIRNNQEDRVINEIEKAELYLLDGSHAMSLPLNISFRLNVDLLHWVEEQNYKVNGHNFWLNTVASTVAVPNGKYDLWIHIVDTNGNERYIDINKSFEKRANVIQLQNFYQYNSTDLHPSNDVQFDIDVFEIDNFKIQYGGWFIIRPDVADIIYALSEAAILLEKDGEILATPLSVATSPDVLEWLKTEGVKTEGLRFRTSLSPDLANLGEIDDGSYNVWAYIKDENSNERYIDMNRIVEKIGSDISIYDVNNHFSIFNATNLLSGASDVQFVTDVFKMNNEFPNQLEYGGWFVVKPEAEKTIHEIANAELILENPAQSLSVPLQVWDSQDVVDWTLADGYIVEGSKFRTSSAADLSKIADGTYHVWVHVVDMQGNSRYLDLEKSIEKSGEVIAIA